MNEYAQIRDYIRKISDNKGVTIFIAEVTKVEEKFCSVKIGDFSLTKVKNFCNEETGNLLIKPKIGSMVTVIDFGDFRDMQIIKVQEVDKVIINGGNNDGLVNIVNLTTKLNQLINQITALKQDYVSHTHPTPSGPSLEPSVPFSGKFSNFNKIDYEDINVTH